MHIFIYQSTAFAKQVFCGIFAEVIIVDKFQNCRKTHT